MSATDGSLSSPPTPLFGGALWPLTGHYAFLESPLESVRDALVAWRNDLGLAPQPRPVHGPLQKLLFDLQPLGSGHRELLVQTSSPWTAYYMNTRYGADEAPLGQLASVLACRALFLIWWPAPRNEAIRFQLHADHPTDFMNQERSVSVQRDDDGRLVFDAFGTVQSFEHTAAYGARRLRDRLTPGMVDEYSRALGLRPFDEDFYLEFGWSITSRDHRTAIPVSIAEEQRRYGYTPTSSDITGH